VEILTVIARSTQVYRTLGTRLMLGSLVVGLVVGLGCSGNPEQQRKEFLESGNALMAQNKPADAIVQYRNAIKADPKFGEAHLRLAEAYGQTGDARRSAQEYIRAADLMPESADTQVKAGTILLFARQFEEAKSRAEKALKADPKSVDAQILLGNATAGTKDVAGAIKEFEEAIELAPADSRAYTALGAAQLAQGQADEAERLFRQAVEVQPTAVPARLALANFLWSANRRPEAEAAFGEALKLEPTNKLANRALAVFHAAGQNPAAAEPYLKALAADPADTSARLALGDYYLRLGRTDDARKTFTQVAAEKSGFAPGTIRLASLAYTDKNPTEAHRLLAEILKREPKNVEALLARSRIQRSEGKAKEALASAQEAVTADPDSVPALYERAMAELDLSLVDEGVKSLREVIRLSPRAVQAHLQLANALLRQRNPAAALRAAEDAMRNAPQNAAARLIVARAQMANNDAAAAAATMEPLQKQFPEAGVVWSQLGTLRMLQKDLKGARQAFERGLALQPGQHDATQGLAMIDLAENKPAAAVARVEAQLAKTPDDRNHLATAARVYLSQRDYPKAETTLRKVLTLDTTNLEAYGMLGQLYLMQNKTEQALKEFETLSKQQPNSVGPHTVIAMLLQSMNRMDEAQQRYERVIQIDRQAPVAANNLAWMYAERGGNLDVALQLAQTARRNLPNAPAVADTLGWVYFKKQQYDMAIRELADAVAKDPENPEYQYHLGAAYAAQGDVPKARMALQKAVARPFAASDDAKKALAALPGA
jgi:tetratricopeptide (TPR) repeat protein